MQEGGPLGRPFSLQNRHLADENAGTRKRVSRNIRAMTEYRFRTPHRSGKWYRSLAQAQHFANAIGAGFLDATGGFVAYRGTVLEMREKPSP